MGEVYGAEGGVGEMSCNSQQPEVLSHWKEIANYLGVPVGTLRHWHYHILPLPYWKSVPRRSGRVMVEQEIVEVWLKLIVLLQKRSQKIKPT